MGMIKDNIERQSILEYYGFEYGAHSGAMGEEGFTKTINHGNETLWVTLSFNDKKLHLYNEWSVGGVLWEESFDIPRDMATEEIIDWVDEIVTDLI